jgi:GTP-binding protein
VEIPVAEYLVEARLQSSWPEAGPREFAFAGRSNVGKSSLLNTLVARKGLARTSQTPGRTRGLVFFTVQPFEHPELRFVDLPGYGYARVSQSERASWKLLIEGFISRRPTLEAVVVIADARRGVEEPELQLCEWLFSIDKRAVLVLTKIDKLELSKRKPALERARAALARAGVKLRTPPIGFSSENRDGREALWRALLGAG